MSIPHPPDEKDLILRLRRGDYMAFDMLYEQYRRLIFYKLKRLVQVPGIVEELHQDVFLKVWEHREQINTEAPFQAYLLRIAKNTAVNFYHKMLRDDTLQQQLMRTSTELYRHVDEYMQFRESSSALQMAVDKLPPQRQRIFVSCKLDGKTYEAVATELGISVGTVKDHMAKAMRFVRKELTGQSDATAFLLLTSLLFS